MTMTPEQWAAALAKIEELLNRPPPPVHRDQTELFDEQENDE